MRILYLWIKNNNMKKSLTIFVILLISGVGYYFYHINTQEYKARKELDKMGIHGTEQDHYINQNNHSIKEEPKVEEKIYTANVCTVCGKKFSGKGYEEVADGVWEQCKEPYQGSICSVFCGRIHTKKMNELVAKTSNKSNGKVYDDDVCSLCKGSGLESGKNLVTGEPEERICPMCDGKGVKGY